MNQNSSRTLIIITTLITALIHLVVLNILLGKIDILFTLNGIGFLTFLALFIAQPAFVMDQRALFTYAYIGFTAITIVAWFILGDLSDLLGIITKVDEAVLIVGLIANFRAEG